MRLKAHTDPLGYFGCPLFSRDPESISAFLSIMRGCDNMCTYCIVPFTRFASLLFAYLFVHQAITLVTR